MTDYRKRLKASREYNVDRDCRVGCVGGYVKLWREADDIEDEGDFIQAACPYCYPGLYPEKWTIN